MNLQEPTGTAPEARDRSRQATLESWKEIAAYLQRDAKTARRWEKEEALPIHRHSHKSGSSVYAYPSEIDSWRASRKVAPERQAAARPVWRVPVFALTLLLCLIMVGNGIRPVSAKQPVAKAARQVWVTRGSDSPTDVSPDGRYFAFIDWRSGGDLAVRDLKTGTERRLTTHDSQQEVEEAIFSPDGRQIAYWRNTWKEPHKNELFTIPATGGAPKRLWTSDGTEDDLWPLGWSPDGKQLQVMRSLPDHRRELALLSIQDGSIRSIKSFGGQSDVSASFSPDGKLIAYDSSHDGNSPAKDIFVMAADGSRETTAVQGGQNPVWSPDGSRILFQSHRTGRNALWSVPWANGKPGKEELVKPDLEERTPVWIARSGAMYYRTPGVGGPNIYSAELSADMKVSKAPVLAVETFLNSNNEPSLSPDGKYLAYQSGTRGLVIRTLATGEERAFGGPSGIWFPDGKSLLITSNVAQGPGPTFNRIDLATGKAELLFRSSGRVQGKSLSLDGKTVFYSEPSRLVRYDLETRRENVLQKADPAVDSFYSVAVSPDGKQLAYVYWSGGETQSIELMPADGGPARELFRGWPSRGNLAWTPDQKYLLFTPPGGYDRKTLWRVPAAGGAAEPTGLSMPGLAAPQVHPDGRRIFFVSNESGPSEIWALENFLPKGAAREGK
jgi:Tol biopolymer transport system component